MKPLASLATLLRPRRLRCSFCRRRADAVGRLVAGASGHICDECITKCVAILQQHGGFVPEASTQASPPR
jgi:ATP-dependent Clp protease ATP-binding subunit ClpX